MTARKRVSGESPGESGSRSQNHHGLAYMGGGGHMGGFGGGAHMGGGFGGGTHLGGGGGRTAKDNSRIAPAMIRVTMPVRCSAPTISINTRLRAVIAM
jgi:hypothetical protein